VISATCHEFIRIEGVSKRFGSVAALEQVSFSVGQGEIHAIVGGNGAGKSSLMKILAGVEQPSAGKVMLDGQLYAPESPREARRRGVSTVFQELNLFSHRSVTENIFANRELTRFGLLRSEHMRTRARAALERVGAAVAPDARVASLSMGERQLVEIARALEDRSRIVIFDEPNSALNERESERLFELMLTLRERGVTSLYVSQRLEEVFKISDRISVLRDGRYQGTFVTRETERDAIITRMLGQSEEATFPSPKPLAADAPAVLNALSISAAGLGPLDLHVRAGEIVGVAGLEGAGVHELMHALFGLTRLTAGRIVLRGTARELRSPCDAMAAGIALVPASRRDEGLMLDASLEKNVSLLVLNELCSRWGLLDRRAVSDSAQKLVERLGIVASSTDVTVGKLSGGNQQKLLLGKWLAIRPHLLLLEDPTRGVDIRAKSQIYRLCQELAERGIAVLYASSELDELTYLCHRILVLGRGRVVRELEHGQAGKAELMRALGEVDAA
jgi:ribose transport system ATP-binding protein